MERIITASLDRIEGDFAVIYADNDQHHKNKFDVPLKLVKGAKPGMRLQLHIENNLITHIETNREATERARDRIYKKYERLRRGRHLRRRHSNI